MWLEAGDYRLEVAPERGASILRAEWRGRPILVPPEGWPAMKSGCFVMAPFANRIADGRFTWRGRDRQLPLNSPDEGMASHGFVRDHPWRVAGEGVFVLDWGGNWPFRIEQRIEVTPGGIAIGLSLHNTGDAEMPFGIGLHPWFFRPEGTRLVFASGGAHLRDERGLPLPERRDYPEFTAGDTPPYLDGCFTGWDGQARILWPGAVLDMQADGALRYLHVFNPAHRDAICVEPVSHLPDAVNRPTLPQMDVLAPGEMLSGAMYLRVSAV